MMDYQTLFQSFSSLKVGVIGDVMLDTYMWGHVERISPEAPVPIVTLDQKEYRIGGAGNVALNCHSLGAQVAVLTVTGNDDDAGILGKLLTDAGINTAYLTRSNDRITTNKTRIISRNQQMMRLDAEITRDLHESDAAQLLSRINNYIDKEKPAIIIFEDYNKGVLTESLITEVIGICKTKGIVTAVDPKKKNFFAYRQVDIFKPNLKEVKEGLNLLVDEMNDRVLSNIHRELHRKLQHRVSFITLSEKGVFIEDEQGSSIIPSHVRSIADVSGAGDTVIAVASLVYAVTKDTRQMAAVANIAGGLVCEEVGTVAINKDRLLQECTLLLG